MAIQAGSIPGVEPQLISVPMVDQVTWKGEVYYFNGWIGSHDSCGVVFEFQNASGSKSIWVDVNGAFVCEG